MNPDYDIYGSEPEPRDPVWLRWLKFASIVFILAVGCGLLVFGADYFAQYKKMDVARAAQETGMGLTYRYRNDFFSGAGIGGAMGLVYVIRCIIRKVDP